MRMRSQFWRMFFKDAGSTDHEALSIFKVGFALALSFSVEAISKAKKGYYVPQNTQRSTIDIIIILRDRDWKLLFYIHYT